ncbi:MAG: methylmalonyl-CoA epimerase [Alphaproteobacteria bacterium]|nr:methylmalonyl-CoA epimerase [Alphaproteobacteria bacterium]
MIGKLNHVAIAVANLDEAVKTYSQSLGAKVSPPQDLPEHGVRVVFVELPNSKIELLSPLGAESPITAFLAKNPVGGMHHICYEVDNIATAITKLQADGVRILGDGKPKIGAHGKPVIFMHPKDMGGVLIELEEV